MTKQLVAVLDKKMRLVGTKYKIRATPDDVTLPDDCDLPLNGTYKWQDDLFVPLGHGFPPIVSRPSATEAEALYDLIEMLGKKAPAKARTWADWYAVNLKKREEEMTRRHNTPKVER